MTSHNLRSSLGAADIGEPQADGDPGPVDSCPHCCCFPCVCSWDDPPIDDPN